MALGTKAEPSAYPSLLADDPANGPDGKSRSDESALFIQGHVTACCYVSSVSECMNVLAVSFVSSFAIL